MFSNTLCFWLYLIVLIPSIICSFFLLYHLLINSALRTALNNHVVILIIFLGLLYEVTDIVWLIYYYHTNTALILKPAFCYAWVLIDSIGYVTLSILVAWASIERHILIFHQNWVSTKTKRVFIHYLPLIILSLYPSIFYVFMYCILPCERVFDYNAAVCNYFSCFTNGALVDAWDSAVDYIIPIFTIVISSLALLLRVLYQKHRIHQRIQWRNYRKMAVQLLSISAIYILFLFPWTILYTAYTAGLPGSVGADYYSINSYLSYFVVMLTPFVCVMSLPELRKKCTSILFCQYRLTPVVHPEIFTINRTNHLRAVTVMPNVQ
jgi:hypothetical protein